jgi:hypothetical protein
MRVFGPPNQMIGFPYNFFYLHTLLLINRKQIRPLLQLRATIEALPGHEEYPRGSRIIFGARVLNGPSSGPSPK